MTEPTNPGGYRPPARPAPASGPGKLSRRTDGQPLAALPDAAYGEQKTFREQQKQSPMAQAQGGSEGPAISPVDLSRVTPLNAPSEFPDEPITSGVDIGAGPGSGVLPSPYDASLDNLREMLPSLEVAASSPSATPFFRSFVRMLRAKQ